MASDLSSGCTDDIEIFNEKEEGEISLEDVSSSEESHPNYRAGFRTTGGCPNCMLPQQCAPWCNTARIIRRRSYRKENADHGKENRRHVKDSSGTIGKHVVSTLQEKNDDEDLVPISSDSEIEIVDLPGNSKHVTSHTSPKSSKVRKKKKRKRIHGSVTRPDDTAENEDKYDLSDNTIVKNVRTSRSHHRESTSPRYNAGATSVVERTVLRSPSRRYRTTRAQKSRSPLKRSRSLVSDHANTNVRKLSRKLRSSRRTPFRSPIRFGVSRASPRESASSPAHVDIYATKLLKKVRHLESVGTFSPKNKSSKSKEHSSLKEKLSNMMKNKDIIVRGEKTKSFNRAVDNSIENENNNVAGREQQNGAEEGKEDEDDDVELLRKLALETKQKKPENKNEESPKETNESAARSEPNLSDDNDSEALELRMIALHSAIMKKHRNRVERGLGSKKRRSENEKRNESPFGMSFIDAIPIPEELSDTSVQSPSTKSPDHNKTNNPEDMELDTDVEREKDSMPYSPTDDLTDERINVDNDLSPIGGYRQISSNDTTTQRNFSSNFFDSEVPNNLSNYRTIIDNPFSPSLPGTTLKIASSGNKRADTSKDTDIPYSPGRSGYDSADSLVNYMENPDAPYSPSKPVEASKLDYATSSPTKSIVNVETPYSPTDTPIYDPELTGFLPDSIGVFKDVQSAPKNQNIDEMAAWDEEITNRNISSNLVPMMLNMSMEEPEISRKNISEGIMTRQERFPENSSSLSNAFLEFPLSTEERMKSLEAIIDELPEIDLDGSPLVAFTKESLNQDIDLSLDTNPILPSMSHEPLYLQGLPDVTRDANKIPTLVNRTLVPASILKTNKQLQKPLPQKKVENVIEPSFKKAEMLPVSETEVTNVRPTKIFKSLKSCAISKKPPILITSASVFNSSCSEDTTGETSDKNFALPVSEKRVKDSSEENEVRKMVKSQEHEDLNKRFPNCDIESKTPSDKISKSLSPARSRIKDKVKAKSVETYFSDELSMKKTESSGIPVARRASSSSKIDQEARSKKTSRDKDSELDSSKPLSKSTTRRDSMDSSIEINSSKTLQKRKSRRSTREVRARRVKMQSNVKKLAMSKNHRSTSIEAGESRSVRSKSTDSGRPKNLDKSSRRASSSPGIDKGILHETRLGTIDRTQSLDSCSEANVSEVVRKRKSRRGEREVRVRRQKGQSTVRMKSTSKNRRRSETVKNATTESDKLVDDANSRTSRSDSVNLELRNSVEKNAPSSNVESSNEKDRDQGKEGTENKTMDKKRRCSLDEDEEALRALLLASLPKRAKNTETSTRENLNSNAHVTNLSDTSFTDTSVENSAKKVSSESFNSDSSLFANLKAPELSSQSSSPASLVPTSNVDTSNPIEAANNDATTENNVTVLLSSSLSSSPMTPKKRPGSVITKNPPKKIVKKVLPVLASTKVVNNAKKYQNTILQKRLNLQRAATLYNAATGSRNITLNNLKNYENSRPTSPKLTNSSVKTQRLVINLESDSDSEAEMPNEEPRRTNVGSETVMSEQRKPLAIPTTDFEKSVVQFLKDQRKKIESNSITTTSTTSLTSSTITPSSTKSPLPSTSGITVVGSYSTPLAVRRHLPVSQQEEYRRLKQQIMERERQMLQKTMSNGIGLQNSINKSPCTPPGPLSPASPIAATLASKSHAQKLSSQVTSPTVVPSREIAREKMEENVGKVGISQPSKTVATAVIENPSSTSTPKASIETTQSIKQNPINTVGKASLAAVKNNLASTTEILGNPTISKISNVPSRSRVTALMNVASASSPSTVTSGSAISVQPTEMLTIQIPNDKLQTTKSTTTWSSKNATQSIETSTYSPKNTAVLRILSKEQLNNRFVKIQVERGPAGRKVTVGSKTTSHDLLPSTDSSLTRTVSKVSDNKMEQSVFCDSNLSFNESNERKRNESSCSKNDSDKNRQETSISKSEASTLVLSRSDNNVADDSTASTLVLTRDDSQTRVNLEPTRLNMNDNEGLSTLKTKQTKNQVKEGWEKIRSDVKKELKMLEALPKNEQEKMLLETQENLVAKRNTVLEDLTEMSGCLRQWEFEREIQTKLIAEVQRLREQLKAAEDRLNEQRSQMNVMGPRVTKTHEKISYGRRECYKLSRICQGLGVRLIGENYKVPNTGAKLLNERLKEVAGHTRLLSKKKVPAMSNSQSEMINIISSSPNATPESIGEERLFSQFHESVNRMDTPSTSMSENDNEDDDDDDDRQTEENGARKKIVSTDHREPTNESTDETAPIIPQAEENSHGEENEKLCLVEENDSTNRIEASDSLKMNTSITVVEVLNVSEGNAPSEETEVSNLSAKNDQPSKNQLAEFSNTKAPTEETKNSRLENINESSKDAEILNTVVTNEPSKKTDSSCMINVVPLKNLLAFDAMQNNNSENTAKTAMNDEINLTSIVPKTSAKNNAEINLAIPGISKSDSRTLRLLDDSKPTGKRKFDGYSSVLAHFKTPQNVNPNGILCPYELMGTCNDGDCQYYHLDPVRQCQ